MLAYAVLDLRDKVNDSKGCRRYLVWVSTCCLKVLSEVSHIGEQNEHIIQAEPLRDHYASVYPNSQEDGD